MTGACFRYQIILFLLVLIFHLNVSLTSASETKTSPSDISAKVTLHPLIVTDNVLQPVSNPRNVHQFTSTADTTVQEPAMQDLFIRLFHATYKISPEIRIARATLAQKQAEHRTALARRVAPSVNARLSQVHAFNQSDDETGTDAPPSETTSAPVPYTDGDDYQDWTLSLDLPLYRRSVSLRLQRTAREASLAAQNLKIKTQQIDLRLRELMGNYLTASYRLLNLQNSVRLSREHVQRIRRGYELRDQTRLQLLRAEANLKELEARRDLDLQRKEAAFRELLDYTGLDASHTVFNDLNVLMDNERTAAACINTLADLDKSYEHIRSFVQPGSNSRDLKTYFLDHSPLWTKIQMEKKLADTKALSLTEKEWPGLSLRGLYERQEDTRFEDFEGEGSLALVLTVPLFSGGTLFSSTKAKTMAQRIAALTSQNSLKVTIHAIENNRNLINSLRQVYEHQKIHLQQQEEIVRLSLQSYDIKQTSMQDLLTSKNRLIDAKNALMETTAKLGFLYRQLAWQLGVPYPVPALPKP